MAASASNSKMGDLEALMSELGLQEEGMDDVVVEQEDPLPPETTRWMAIARVHTEKKYSQYGFYKTMRATWDLAPPVQFRPWEENLYTMQFSCLGDWERVTQGGAWHFRGNPVIIVPYDGYSKPTSIKLFKFEIWARK